MAASLPLGLNGNHKDDGEQIKYFNWKASQTFEAANVSVSVGEANVDVS